MQVVKMHGARNDFVLVDARCDSIENASALARRLCDRRSGIGADGLLLVQASAIADARMTIVNADGSEAEMCGNGIRCFARYLDENGEGDELAIETASGIVRTRVISRAPEYLVRVWLPRPESIQHPEPVLCHPEPVLCHPEPVLCHPEPVLCHPELVLCHPELVEGRTSEQSLDTVFIRVGNPHAILLRDSLDGIDLDKTAEEFQQKIPGGINVHVATVVDDHTLKVKHWERGVGQTQACGTGSAACAVAGIEKGLVTSPVAVVVPGGTLIIEWTADSLTMTGPTVRVFGVDLTTSCLSCYT